MFCSFNVSLNQTLFSSLFTSLLFFNKHIYIYIYLMEVVKQLGIAFGADWDSFGGARKSWQLPSSGGKASTQAEHKQVVARATTAINELQIQLIDLLDVRARSYSELREFDKALEDASVMIRTSPCIVKGYIRAGKNLVIDTYSARSIR
ncbi:hypothetical protein BDB00DRAFT_343853 [Zychaea mexicana]|uniref:uncharacterized protein n=1 Tax=Zychaea mexicana TaxID=64656 RepID=UPI0022FE5E23|nr:uncharacterized protein BDB00DRAFT_343853 [Zychaea mexicana]KAI9494044.1 hypothetical protein BDB00DRAFT_343853 [Zychaea mexicana]